MFIFGALSVMNLKRRLSVAVTSVLILTAVWAPSATAISGGRVLTFQTIDGLRYCIESFVTPANKGELTVHSTTSCANATAAGRPASWLGVLVEGWIDSNRDGKYDYCGTTGWHYNPVGNTWAFSVGPSSLCPTPSGLQNYRTYTHGQVWNPAIGGYASITTIVSPVLTI
ncbi:MAG: hypothetical protein ABMA25_00615 [Ilumatobacteraceae bacterium]